MAEPSPQERYLGGLETHDIDEVRQAFDRGLDPKAPINGRTPAQWLTEMYFRSPRFADMARLVLDRGATLDDPELVPVLTGDIDGLRRRLDEHPGVLHHRTTLVSVFTPLEDATLLHVAAEYALTDVARVLLDAGLDVDGRAGTDRHGLNGQTPLFHTVNSNWNVAYPLMRLLLERGARTDVLLTGIVWGRGQDWETTLFDVTPLSYAQFGLLPQFHRRSTEIFQNVVEMLTAAGRPVPPLENVPNKYSREFAIER